MDMENNFKSKFRRRGFLLFPLMMIALLLIAGYVVMFLWNEIIPQAIPSVNRLSYWHATGLLVLARILFGGFKGRHRGAHTGAMPYWKEKMANMSDEEKEKFKMEWKSRCGKN